MDIKTARQQIRDRQRLAAVHDPLPLSERVKTDATKRTSRPLSPDAIRQLRQLCREQSGRITHRKGS